LFAGNFIPYSGNFFIKEGKVIGGNASGSEQGFSYLWVIALKQGQELVADSIS